MRARFAITTVPPQDTSTETLPASLPFLAVRYGFVALTIPIDVDPDMAVVVIAPRSSEVVAGRPS